MSKELTKADALKAERLLPQINANHRECMKCGRDSVNHAMEAGELLLQLKSCVKHGEFESTVEKRCDFAVRTAQAYMKLSAGLPPLLEKLGKELGIDATIGGCLKLITESKKPDKPKAQGVRLSPTAGSGKKLPSQSDEPPTPAEDETAQVDTERGVAKHSDTFEPSTFKDESLDLPAKQAPYDAMLNALTLIQKHWNAITEDQRDGVYAVDKKNRVNQILRDLRPPLAQARPEKVCDHCQGKGCKKCQNCGWWPRSVVEGLKK